MASAELVVVLFAYEYQTKDGRCITIQPNDRYILVSRTNDHWWHVRKDPNTKPFYIPARYVKVLDPDPGSVPLDTPSRTTDRDGASDTSKDEKSAAGTEPDQNQNEEEIKPCWLTPTGDKTEVDLPTSPKEPEGLYDNITLMSGMPLPSTELIEICLDPTHHEEREGEEVKVKVDHNGGTSSVPLEAEDEGDSIDLLQLLPAGPPLPFQDPDPDPNYVYEDCIDKTPSLSAESKTGVGPEQASGNVEMRDLIEDGVYESIENQGSDETTQEMEHAPAEPGGETPVTGATFAIPEKAKSPVVAVESVLPPTAADKVEEDDSPVYVNLPPFRRKPTDPPFDSSEPSNTSPPLRVSSPPSSSPLSQSPKDLERDLPTSAAAATPDSGAWEVHVDEDSGQEFYFHPASGQATWDRPAALMMDPAVGVQELPGMRQRSSRSSTSTPPSPSIPTSPPAGPAPNPPLTSAVTSSSPPGWRASDWERVVDEASGQPYYYNQVSGETSWDPPEELQGHGHKQASPKTQSRDEGPPPLPKEDYPAEDEYALCLDDEDSAASHPPGVPAPVPGGPSPSEYSLAQVRRSVIPRASLDRTMPPGWNLHIDPDGAWVFTSEHSHEQWIKSLDDRGQTYYYLRDGSRSQWNLPELSPSHTRVRNGSTESDGTGVMRNWRQSVVPSQEEKFQPTHRRNFSDYGSDMSSSPEMHSQVMPENPYHQSQHLPSLEKAGILNKTKVSENGKKVRKNWAQSWTVLHGGVLTFHKDPKSAPGSTSTKSNQFLTEFTVDLRGASIAWAGKEKSSKKNVLELKSQNGSEYLIQYDTESIINDWHKVIQDTIRQLEQEQQQHHSEEEDDVYEKVPGVDDRPHSGPEKKRTGSKQGFTSSTTSTTATSTTSDADQKKVRTKLRKFLLKRPTLQSVKEKGYIRENVFGCHLPNLCAQERTTVPTFVEKCIRTVESRGLGMDGIYRVSGNLATIQKLRFKADHEDIDFEEGHWDIHVITGALKLFFRELQEPLFPYSHFNNFIAGIKIPNYHEKVSYMYKLVKTLPTANHDTMEMLFRHLRKVIEHGEENRMSVQNIAIVFGPTLLKPEVESANLTMFMVFQNQIVEFILNEFDNIFYSG